MSSMKVSQGGEGNTGRGRHHREGKISQVEEGIATGEGKSSHHRRRQTAPQEGEGIASHGARRCRSKRKASQHMEMEKGRGHGNTLPCTSQERHHTGGDRHRHREKCVTAHTKGGVSCLHHQVSALLLYYLLLCLSAKAADHQSTGGREEQCKIADKENEEPI